MKAKSYVFRSLCFTAIVTPGAIARSIALDLNQKSSAQKRPETAACENLAEKRRRLYTVIDSDRQTQTLRPFSLRQSESAARYLKALNASQLTPLFNI